MDYLVIFEALTCLGGISCVYHVPLTSTSEEHFRNRQRHVLSEKATSALRLIFEEFCSPGAPGMTGRDLESYLRRCGVDYSRYDYEVFSTRGQRVDRRTMYEPGGILLLQPRLYPKQRH